MSAPHDTAGSRGLFVLGLQRSGTTYLGNLLAAHPQIAAITDARHQGIHESVFFSHFAEAWDYADPAQRRTAIAAFLSSDYGQLLAPGDALRARIGAQESAGGIFCAAMDGLAAREGASLWAEKSPHHTAIAGRIARALPGARFIAVERSSAGLIASRLQAYGRTPPRGLRRWGAILRGAVSNACHKRLIARLARAHPGRVLRLRFEEFRAGGPAALDGLTGWLGIDPAPGLAPGFAPNSSFASEAERARALSTPERLAIRAAEALARLVPLPLLDTLRRRRAPHPPVFPHWVWPAGTMPPEGVRIAAPRALAPRTATGAPAPGDGALGAAGQR